MIQVRERMNSRLNRARLALELKRSGRSLVVVLIGAALGLAIFAYIAAHVSKTLLSSTRQVSFAVNDATAVQPGVQEVRFQGIPAGTITTVVTRGSTPVVTASIDTKYGPIYRNATAELRPNTALQDMYLDIVNRGSPAAGIANPSTPLPASQTSTSVNVDDVLNVFGPDVRANLSNLLDNLGNGMRDHGAQLRTAFTELVPFLQIVGRISTQISQRAATTRALVHNAALLTSDLAASQSQLHELVGRASVLVQTLERGSPQLSATLQQLPPTLSILGTSFAAVRRILGPVDTAVNALYPVAGILPGSLAEVRKLNAVAAPAVRALEPPVAQLVPFSEALLPVSNQLQQTVASLLPLIHTVDHTTRDLVACKNGVQGFFQWDASLTKYGDVRGAVPRGNLALGATSSGLINDPSEYAPQACTPGVAVDGRVPTPKDKH
jgi:ABC-type transporter Mla subunit MlaD